MTEIFSAFPAGKTGNWLKPVFLKHVDAAVVFPQVNDLLIPTCSLKVFAHEFDSIEGVGKERFTSKKRNEQERRYALF